MVARSACRSLDVAAGKMSAHRGDRLVLRQTRAGATARRGRTHPRRRSAGTAAKSDASGRDARSAGNRRCDPAAMAAAGSDGVPSLAALWEPESAPPCATEERGAAARPPPASGSAGGGALSGLDRAARGTAPATAAPRIADGTPCAGCRPRTESLPARPNGASVIGKVTGPASEARIAGYGHVEAGSRDRSSASARHTAGRPRGPPRPAPAARAPRRASAERPPASRRLAGRARLASRSGQGTTRRGAPASIGLRLLPAGLLLHPPLYAFAHEDR